MHILVLRAGALGDIILTLPAIRALRRRYPEARLTALGPPERWSLIPEIDDIWDGTLPLFAGIYDTPSDALRNRAAGADLAIAWTTRAPKGLATLDIPTIHASPYPPPGIHAADWLVRSLGPHADPRPDDHLLTPVPRGRTIYLHPGAGALWKRWPSGRFATLARCLPRPISLVEGPADAAAVSDILQQLSLPVAREPDVTRLAAHLADAALLIGHDSGVTHLAAALGIPTIALFGPTDPANWAPRGNVLVVRHCRATTRNQGELRVCEGDCLETITVDEVLAAAAKLRVDRPVENVSNLPA